MVSSLEVKQLCGLLRRVAQEHKNQRWDQKYSLGHGA